MSQRKTYINWSSGKDAAMALHILQQDRNFDVCKLVTSINGHHNRVSMHGLRRAMLQAQAKALSIPLQTIELPEMPSMADYNHIMTETVSGLKAEGFTDTGFGDIFLEDLRQYREDQLKPLDIKCHFPLWKKATKELLHEFIDLGFKAIVVCIKSDLLDKSFAGRLLDNDFIKDLPSNVDPCGENGEFHTFCFDGPIFKHQVGFKVGEKVYRAYNNPEDKTAEIGFWFCDLEPV